jgi:hypothetical protein
MLEVAGASCHDGRQPKEDAMLPWTALVGLLALTDPEVQEAPQRLTLSGILKSEAGKPVPGATVFIHTAGPRKGTSSTCPSCYLDCRKKGQSNARGEFHIDSLDPRLRFTLLVVGKGYKARLVPRVDPVKGPQAIGLERLDLAGVEPERVIRGRLTQADGRPAVGAVLEVSGVRRGDTTRFGGNDDVDPVAVTDGKGEFVILAKQPVSEVLVRIEGAGVARRSASFTPSEVRLTEGVTVKGRVVAGDKPVPGVVLGMVSKSRRSSSFLGDYQATTDDDGRFSFPHMPPRLELVVYGKMESFGERGLPATLAKTTGDDGSTVDVGDLPLAAAHRVAGRIVLQDGKPIPEGTRLGLHRQEAWDTIEVVLGPDGAFRFAGVPAEKVEMSARLPGYRFSLANPSADWRRRDIEGRVDRDIDDLTLVMEPGEPEFNNGKPPPGVEPDVSEKPLRAARKP